ncbi:MAG: hypothetical protein K2Y51_08175 [Gammaproteobacteria bacterium]|jgi:hypothetical protein|nr:hypothetical protein [Gammaproteobacteria bacterium]
MLGRLLPALMPSWRFFDAIGPSPRVDYAWVEADATPTTWHEFRPRPARVGVAHMFARLFWNPRVNETLYIVRSAERVVEGDTDFPARELRWRLLLALGRGELVARTASALCFRVRAVYRDDGAFHDEVVYVSAPFATEPAAER